MEWPWRGHGEAMERPWRGHGEFWKRHVERTRAELERGREIGCVRAGKDNARRERYTTPPGGDEDGSGESGATG